MGQPTSKPCSKCGDTKPLTEFGKKSANRDGLEARRKPCIKVDKAESYQRNREAANARSRRWYEANREDAIARQIEWKKANPEKVSRYRRTAYVNNREHELALARAWQEANAERFAEILRDKCGRRRARKRLATTGPVDLDALWDACNGICSLCDSPIDRDLAYPHPLSRSVDHIVPLSRGGSHEQSNLQWTHLVCNNRKGAKAP